VNLLENVHKNKKDCRRFRTEEMQVKRLLHGDVVRVLRQGRSEN